MMAAQLIEMKNKDPEFFDSVLEQLPVYESSCIMDAISYSDWGVCSGKCKGSCEQGRGIVHRIAFLNGGWRRSNETHLPSIAAGNG